MRTFLPYDDFAKCAACFTMKRLTKQRHDAMEILYLLSGRNHPSRGDRFMYNSPPKKVWMHCPMVLCQYIFALCDEYEKRTGKVDPVRDRCAQRQEWFRRRGGPQMRNTAIPEFMHSEAMQRSHRAILARQDEQHYGQFGFERDPDDEKVFYWPVDEADAQYNSGHLELDGEFDDSHDSDNDDECDCEACQEARA